MKNKKDIHSVGVEHINLLHYDSVPFHVGLMVPMGLLIAIMRTKLGMV